MTKPSAVAPAPLPDFDPSILVDVDVRDDLRAGREPLSRIIAAAESLGPGLVLHVRSLFQPTPLFTVLSRLGFSYNTERFAEDDWSSWFWRGHLEPRNEDGATLNSGSPDEWDLRSLPAPEPLQRILARIAVDPSPFDVLLPDFSDVLPAMLAPSGWRAEVVGRIATDGVRVRITPAG